MPSTLPIAALGLALCLGAFAQNPPPRAPQRPSAPHPRRRHGARPRQQPASSSRADIAALLAREDTVQAKAALLPERHSSTSSSTRSPTASPTGVFVSNDGAHVYNNQALVHADIYAPDKLAEYRKAQVAEALAHAEAEIAARGLAATVVADFYGMASAGRKLATPSKACAEAQRFLDITQKQEKGGEAAHADVVKAQIQVEQRQREAQEAQLALDKARLEFSVLLFPDFRQDFTVADDLDAARVLPSFPEIQAMAARTTPISARPRRPWKCRIGTSKRPAPPGCRRSPSTTSSA